MSCRLCPWTPDYSKHTRIQEADLADHMRREHDLKRHRELTGSPYDRESFSWVKDGERVVDGRRRAAAVDPYQGPC